MYGSRVRASQAERRRPSNHDMERIATTRHGLKLLVNKPAADEARIAAFEARLGHRLPDDYRAFLLQYNGGRPAQRGFQFTRRPDTHVRAAIHWFLSLHDGEASNLEQTAYTLRERIPPDTLAIANDPSGGYVLLGLHGESRGKVYFWDPERAVAGRPDGSNIDLVADSLDSFLSRLETIHPR